MELVEDLYHVLKGISTYKAKQADDLYNSGHQLVYFFFIVERRRNNPLYS
jgi:hypothetical protein